MDMMTSKYDGYFAGIAVHNSDPMTVTDYDAAVGSLISGYPSGFVDRGPETDPSTFEGEFLTKITNVPDGFLVNGATYNSTSRVLEVSVTTTLQQNISGDFKVACVITEDSVTGTASTYNQSNAYSGGASGVMGGFELLANPVPAAQMNYNHVARAISPDFTGIPSAYGTSASSGQVFTHNFSFTLPVAWDATQIHIIGMMIDPSGVIDNAASATIPEAVANGWLPGTATGINQIAAAPDATIQLMPNPANTVTFVTLNLNKESNIKMEVYSPNGKLVASKEYGQLNGAYNLPINTEEFSSGIYFVKVSVNNEPTILKLIKE
jgi:hypothetical protein